MARVSIKYKINGIESLSRKLKALPNDLRKKVVMGGMKKGATEIKKNMVANLQAVDDPKTPNVIAKNVAIRFSPIRYKRTGDVMYRVGILGGSSSEHDGDSPETDPRTKNPGGSTFYWRFLEFGTLYIEPRGMVRTAAATSGAEAIRLAGNEMSRLILKDYPAAKPVK